MPYNCMLTSENRCLYEERIARLIDIFFLCFDQVVADCIITRMYEYLLAYPYIDTHDEVHQKEAIKLLGLSSKGRALFNLMSQIRNYDVHAPSGLNAQLYHRFRENITSDSIKDVTGFYLCPDKAATFLEYQAGQLKETTAGPQRMEV